MSENFGRIDRIRKVMKDQDLKAVIVYSDNNNPHTPRPLYYLSNFWQLAPHAVLVLPTEGKITLFVSSQTEAARAAKESWVKDIKVMKDPIDTIAANAKRWNTSQVEFLTSENIGPWMREEVERKLGSKLHPLKATGKKDSLGADLLTSSLLDDMGQGQDELELARRLARIADKEFLAALEVMKPGITEYEVVAEVDYAGTMEKVDDNFTLICASRHNSAMHYPTRHRLQEGDIVDFEITPSIKNQVMQLCRTAVLGKHPKIIEEKYAILQKALSESLKVIKPGVLASEIVKVQNRIISEAGYAEYCRPPYMRTRGHGYGMGSNAVGLTLTEKTDIPLREGQNMVVHPNQYIPETGYLACGDAILVTSTGFERCTQTDAKVYVVEV